MGNILINSVVVNSSVTQITVSGSGFQSGTTAPNVRFDGTVLTVTSFSDTQFVASLPSGLGPGSYLLEVATSNSFNSTNDFEVTIGTQGLTGATGPQGPAGPAGPQGPSGAADLLVGFVANSGFIEGYAKDLTLDTTVRQIPALGIGFANPGTAYDAGPVTNNFRVNIESPLLVTLYATLKNLTSGAVLSLAVSPGNTTGVVRGSMVNNPGDSFAILLNINSGSISLPNLQWYTF